MNLVKQARQDRRWSQARLVSELCRQARDLGETLPARESLKTMLSRWENDRVAPDPLYQQLLARAFECSPQQLGLTGRSGPVLARGSDLGDQLLAVSTESSADALTRSSHLAPEVLPHLVQQVMRIAHSYDAESRTVAFQQARAARDLALALVERTCRPSELADLYLALGQVNALMASLAFDLDRWQASEHLAIAATTYADMSGHASMKAWTLGLEATIAFWNGDGEQALHYIGAGLAVAPTGAPQFRLHHIAARAHAANENPDGVAAALAAADVQQEIAEGKRDELHDEIGGEFYFSESRAEACAGAAWLKVRDGARALVSTQRALDLSAGVSPGIRAGAQIDSAAACLMQGDLSEASARLEPVLQIDPDPQSVSLGGRFGTVRQLLDEPPWQQTDRAASLRGQIDGWLAGAHMRPQLTQ